MPRHRTPLAEAEATGALEKNKKRYAERVNAPAPKGPIGEPPNHFDDVDRDLWHEVVAMPADGVLTSADRVLVEITVQLLRRLRGIEYAASEDDHRQSIAPLTGVEMGHLRACLGSMGCTPADRTRVKAGDGKEDKKDPLAVLFGANGAGHPGHTN
jgi:hypothetical protein